MARRIRWKRLLLILLVIVLVIVAASATLRWLGSRGPVQHVQATVEQIERGRYLAAAADCAACHTQPGGAPFAGGFPLETPFGTIYGTNITPDPEHGIGRYTAEDFHTAVTHGTARGARPLYPAMPYVSYRGMTREDSDAIYAFLMNQPAVAQPNHRNNVSFPANIRESLYFWKLLFAGSEPRAASSGTSPAWQRGRYLVDTLGHCGECHTPRGVLGQMKNDQPMAGNTELGRHVAPDITPDGLAARGWDAAGLRSYLSTGIGPVAVASDEMLTVVNLSTSRLSADDLDAMTTYLVGDTAKVAQAPRSIDSGRDATGRRHYLDVCAGCHGRDAEGVPNVAVNLRNNSSVRDDNPNNLLVAILDGLPAHDFPGTARMQEMPGFAQDLDDAQVAELATWLRQHYAGQSSVDPATVAKLRKADKH